MAGDWIKMRVNIGEDPAVIAMACALRVSEDEIVGKLHRLWSGADQHSTNGRVDGVSVQWIDRHVNCRRFGDVMEKAGWLEVDQTGITFPHFDRHNGASAKSRAMDAERKRQGRSSGTHPP